MNCLSENQHGFKQNSTFTLDFKSRFFRAHLQTFISHCFVEETKLPLISSRSANASLTKYFYASNPNRIEKQNRMNDGNQIWWNGSPSLQFSQPWTWHCNAEFAINNILLAFFTRGDWMFFLLENNTASKQACRGKKCLQTSVPAIRLYHEFHSVVFSHDFIHILIFSFRWQFTPTITTQPIDKPDKAVFHNITASSSW